MKKIDKKIQALCGLWRFFHYSTVEDPGEPGRHESSAYPGAGVPDHRGHTGEGDRSGEGRHGTFRRAYGSDGAYGLGDV